MEWRTKISLSLSVRGVLACLLTYLLSSSELTKPERICVSTQLNSTEQRVLSYIVISRWPGRPSRPSTPSCAAAKLPFDTMGCTPLSFIISVLALCCAGVIMGFSAYVINETTFLFTSSWTVGS